MTDTDERKIGAHSNKKRKKKQNKIIISAQFEIQCWQSIRSELIIRQFSTCDSFCLSSFHLFSHHRRPVFLTNLLTYSLFMAIFIVNKHSVSLFRMFIAERVSFVHINVINFYNFFSSAECH
jgi:hypothetical protein